MKNPRSGQVMVPGAKHFFEGREDELVRIVAGFLDRTLAVKP
jgi:alpha/beta superfamily hydrolase